jgi:hypothetical protein
VGLKYSKINKWSETAFNWKQAFAVLAGEAASGVEVRELGRYYAVA